jgi:signal transduction histidine kinase
MTGTIKYAFVLTQLLFLLFLCGCSTNDDKGSSPGVGDISVLLNKAADQPATEAKTRQIHFIDSAIAGKQLTVSDRLKVYEFKAGIYTNQLGDHKKATIVTDSMIDLVEANGTERYKAEYALAHYNKGDILFNQKKYNEAYSHYYQARLVGKTSLDSCTLGEYSFRLALILYRQSRFIEAAEQFRTALNESGTCKLDFIRYFRLQQVLNNIGLSFYKAGEPDSALQYYQRALDYIAEKRVVFNDHERQYLNDIANAVIYGNMADIYRVKGDTARAKQLLRQSIHINTRKGHDAQDAQFSQVKLAELLFQEGYVDSTSTLLQQLRRGLDTMRNLRAEMDWNRLAWKYHEKRNDPSAAYPYLMRFTQLRDTLERESELIKSADLSQQIRILENQYEIQALQKDNELKNVYLWVVILAAIAGVAIIFFVFRNLKRSRKNVTLLQSLNAQVNEQKMQLQHALASVEDKSRQQERIMRAVAHDLRGPVATISMLCDLILNEKDETARAEMVNFIRTSCNNSLALIAEILEAADQSKRKEMEKEPTNMNVLVRNAIDLLQIKASEKSQTIDLRLPGSDLYLNVNPEKIQRVISNLVTNAIKFSPKKATIRVKLESENKLTRLIVEDDGIGIPDDIKPRVFDMFTEAKRKGTSGELPYGLGLSICKQIVEAHNGSIYFDSVRNEGTRFFVELPQGGV